jgi:hypothetical protein
MTGKGATPAPGRDHRVAGAVLVAVGAIAWAVAWVVPAAVLDGPVWGDTSTASSDPRPVAGVHAFLWAGQLVPDALAEGDLLSAALGSTCATNVVMLAALLLHRFVAWGGALGRALLVCNVLNATWLLCERDMVATYSIGFWLWLGSFGVTGLGILLARARS